MPIEPVFNYRIFIAGNVPSSKNSKIWTGKFLVHSKTVRNYLKEFEYQYAASAGEFRKAVSGKTFPLHIKFRFIRDSKRKFDFINAAQIICDMMVKHKWIEDDSTDFIVPYFNELVFLDKEHAGVEIIIL